MDKYNEQSRVVFKGDDFQYSTQSFQPRTSKITQWTIKCSSGLIKNEKQANVVLLGFAMLAIIVSLVLIFSGGIKESKMPLPSTPLQGGQL